MAGFEKPQANSNAWSRQTSDLLTKHRIHREEKRRQKRTARRSLPRARKGGTERLCSAVLCAAAAIVWLAYHGETLAGLPRYCSSRRLTEKLGKAVVVDVDKDGHNDVLIRVEDSLLWYRFEDAGTFKENLVSKNRPFSGDRIALADVDGDGDQDLVTALKEGSRYALVWIGNPLPNGDPAALGSWSEHLIGEVNDYVKDIAVADFNRDGKPDVVTREHTQTTLFFQRDSKHWPDHVALRHETHEGMAVGDLDRDGDSDIVLNGFWFETPDKPLSEPFRKHVFDKKWFTPSDGSWRDNNCAIVVADVNRDGLLDIAVSQSELPGYPISLYYASSIEAVRTNQWTEVLVAKTFDFCQTLDVGDVDNDGDLDMLAAKFERDHRSPQWRNAPPYPVAIFENLHADGLAWKAHILSEEGMYAGILGDVGSDGDLDIVGPRTYWAGPTQLYDNQTSDEKLALDTFKYIQIDNSRSKRFFGLAMGDLTGDGYADIVAGQWFYRNPGDDLSGRWQRVDVEEGTDLVLVVDVDGDELGDCIGLKPDKQLWLEARDKQCTSWNTTTIGTLPIRDHNIGSQQYALAQIVPGGKPEILLAAKGIYYMTIPAHPERTPWPATRIASDGAGYAAGDIDRDGWIDVAGTYGIPGGENVPGAMNVRWDCSMVAWWKNPGNGSSDWQRFDVGKATHADRFEVADLNGDGRLDIIVSEERYPGSVPNARLFWYEQPLDLQKAPWRRHVVVTQTSMNNLDVGDMDRDGDADIITCEHKMPTPGSKEPIPENERLQIWENDGKGHFTERLIDTGKESHLGARVFDMDGDGDLDIVSTAWRNFQFLHLWRNDALATKEAE